MPIEFRIPIAGYSQMEQNYHKIRKVQLRIEFILLHLPMHFIRAIIIQITTFPPTTYFNEQASTVKGKMCTF